MRSVWSLDNVFIGGSLMTPDMLYETFDTELSTDVWSFWPGGRIAEYCMFNTRSTFINYCHCYCFPRSDSETNLGTFSVFGRITGAPQRGAYRVQRCRTATQRFLTICRRKRRRFWRQSPNSATATGFGNSRRIGRL